MSNTKSKSPGSLVIIDHGLKGYKIQIRSANGSPTYSTVQGLDTVQNVIKNIKSACNTFFGNIKHVQIKDATRNQRFVQIGFAVPYRFRKDGGMSKPLPAKKRK